MEHQIPSSVSELSTLFPVLALTTAIITPPSTKIKVFKRGSPQILNLIKTVWFEMSFDILINHWPHPQGLNWLKVKIFDSLLSCFV